MDMKDFGAKTEELHKFFNASAWFFRKNGLDPNSITLTIRSL